MVILLAYFWHLPQWPTCRAASDLLELSFGSSGPQERSNGSQVPIRRSRSPAFLSALPAVGGALLGEPQRSIKPAAWWLWRNPRQANILKLWIHFLLPERGSTNLGAQGACTHQCLLMYLWFRKVKHTDRKVVHACPTHPDLCSTFITQRERGGQKGTNDEATWPRWKHPIHMGLSRIAYCNGPHLWCASLWDQERRQVDSSVELIRLSLCPKEIVSSRHLCSWVTGC